MLTYKPKRVSKNLQLYQVYAEQKMPSLTPKRIQTPRGKKDPLCETPFTCNTLPSDMLDRIQTVCLLMP